MKFNIYNLLIFLVLVFAGLAVAAGLIKNDEEVEDGQKVKLEVATTIFALYDIAKNVAGENAEVHLILPPGASPHTFEFSPKDISKIQNVKAIFTIGYGIDNWARVVEGSIPNIEFVQVDSGIVLKDSVESFLHEEEGAEEEEEHGPIDPHYWLNFGNARIIAENIKNELIRLDPENGKYYEANTIGYKQRLVEKENELIIRAASIKGEKIITLHDAWFYFSDNFGLNIQGSFEPSAGKEPTPRYLAEFLKKIREENIKVIFAERLDTSMSLQNFARENNLAVVLLDPIEGGIEGRDDFIELMEYNVNTIVEAFE